MLTPALKINWVPNSGLVFYDLKPTAVNEIPVKPDVDSTSPAPDAAYPYDNVKPLATELGTDLCTELWRFSDTSVTCVLAKGTVVRNFKTVDPFNRAGTLPASKQDLDLDYLIYSTNVMFGEINPANAALQFTFPAVNVNFDTFNEVSTGAVQSLS